MKGSEREMVSKARVIPLLGDPTFPASILLSYLSMKGGESDMGICIICGLNKTHGRSNYCTICMFTRIRTLDLKYGIRRGPFSPAKDKEEAPASNPLAEKPTTHRVS